MADALRIGEFPKGRWWVYWVDQYRFKLNAGHGIGVHVRLAPYTEEYDFQEDGQGRWPLLPLEGTTKTILVGVRLIPALSIGSIFTDGKQDGHIQSVKRSVRSFDVDQYPSEIVKASQDFLPAPSFWTKHPHTVLSRSEYPLGAMLDSWCVVLRSADEHTIIPCHEVFRAFYGSSADFAEALVSGPWEENWKLLAVEKDTRVNPDNSWQVSVQRRVPDIYQEQLGYMLFGNNGRKQSNAIFAHFSITENKKSLGTNLKVGLPFDRALFKLDMRRVRLQKETNKFLCTSILGSSYPCELNAEFLASRGNSNAKGAVQVETGKPKPYGGTSQCIPATSGERDIAQVVSDKDADERYFRENCAVEPLNWFDAPRKQTLQKEESGIYLEQAKKHHRSEAAELASVNASGYSNTERQPIDIVRGEVLPATARYELLVQALDALVESKRLDAWSVIEPSNVQRRYGAHAVWLFPTHLLVDENVRPWAWSYVDRKTDTRRSALVLRVVVRGVSCIWVEIECRLDEGIRSVLFRNTTDELDIVVIGNVLAECAYRKGTVYKGEGMRGQFDLEHLQTWRHSVKKGTAQLNEASLLLALEKLVPRS